MLIRIGGLPGFTGMLLVSSAILRRPGSERGPARGGHPVLSLYHGDRKVVEGHMRATSRPSPAGSRSRGEGLCVGRDSGEPYLDLEREAAALIMRE